MQIREMGMTYFVHTLHTSYIHSCSYMNLTWFLKFILNRQKLLIDALSHKNRGFVCVNCTTTPTSASQYTQQHRVAVQQHLGGYRFPLLDNVFIPNPKL